MTLTREQWAEIIADVAGLAQKLDAINVMPFKDATKRLLEALQPVLPAKDDGMPYTDDELHAMAEAAKGPFQQVIDRSGQ